jgi:DNA-binding NarL/FixJ family response regulator
LKKQASIAGNVLIVSKRALVQEALAAFIGTAPDLAVAAHCSSLEEHWRLPQLHASTAPCLNCAS